MKKEISKDTQEKIYNYLKEKHYGKENGIKARNLSVRLSVPEYIDYQSKRELRRICTAINQNPDLGFISTSGSIYVCKTKEEVDKAIDTTWKSAITWIKKAKAMSDKRTKQGQYEFTKNGKKIKIYFED